MIIRMCHNELSHAYLFIVSKADNLNWVFYLVRHGLYMYGNIERVRMAKHWTTECEIYISTKGCILIRWSDSWWADYRI